MTTKRKLRSNKILMGDSVPAAVTKHYMGRSGTTYSASSRVDYDKGGKTLSKKGYNYKKRAGVAADSFNRQINDRIIAKKLNRKKVR